MTKHRVLLWILLGVMTVSAAVPALAAPAPKEKTPPVGQRAGAISALLPVATVTRGTGKTALKGDLKKGDPLFWNDLVQTAKGGRARITLADQSILSLGSQAELRIVKHDAKTQQTLLQMTYGRVRAEVSQITRDGGRFEVRTPTAVAGVIGTDFGTESGVGSTTFVCISGAVSVANSDPAVPGSVQCGAGQTTTVATGKAPTTPVPATPAQIQQLITDTEPAQISALSPAAALPGATVDASVSGTKLTGTNSVQVAGGAGVTVTLNQGTTDTAASLHIVVAANAAAGPRTITLAKPSGTNSATVFTVLSPPNTAQNTSGDPKKPYHDTLDQLRQTGDSSLSTIVAALQQIVDQANQALSQANQNLTPAVDLSQANSGLNGQITALQTAATAATQQIDQAAGSAGAGFDNAYTTAYNALLQRNSAGTPDDTFNQAVSAAFQTANNSLQQAIVGAQNSLRGQVQTAGNQIGQIAQTWMNTINTTASSQQSGPTPASNGVEKSVDVGAELTLDASSSKATSGASIVAYNWSLCDASYKPSQFGVPLVGNPAGCNALPGMMSSNAQFTIATCNLTPGDYIARETVVDSNQKIASMDNKVHILAGTYDDPATRLKNLAAAYSALQISQFLSYFDQINFSGYNALSQNVQSTFPTLASMNINVIVSQNTQSCNTANLRANWDLNYQNKPVCSAVPVLDSSGNPTGQTQQVCSTPPLQKASEQLQVRMNRTPGVGWQVTDFQGDNGTVTNNVGALPAGPSATTFSAEPDVVVAGLQIANSVSANNSINVAGNTTTNFTVTVANTGDADLTTVMPVHFAIRDGSGNELVGTNQNIPTPLAKGGTVQMSVSMAVPNLAPQTPLSYVAIANPGCSVTEKNCGADDIGNLPFLVGIPLPDLRILGISYAPVVPNTTFVSPGPETFTVNLTNAGSLALTSPTTVHFVLTDGSGTQIGTSDQNIAVPLNGGASTTVAATFTIPASGPGAQFTLAAVANPGCTVQEIACANDPLQSGNVKLTLGQANYIIVPNSLAFNGKSGPFTGVNAIQVGTSPTVAVTVQNTGNITQSGSITVTLACSGGTGCNNPLTATIAAPAAGQSVVATANSNGINNTPGTYTGTATLSTTLPQSSTADDSLTENFDVLDYTLTSSNASASPVTIFLGGNFNLSVLLTEMGSTPFAMPITSGTTNSTLTTTAPNTLTSGSPQNVNVAAAFTSSTGSTNLTVMAGNQGITKTITQPLTIVAPFVQTASPNMQSGLTSQALTLQVNTAGALTLGTLPSGISIDSKATCSIGAQTTANATVRAAGNVTWCLQAAANSATGALTAPVSMTATNPADFSGTYTVPVTMSVNGVPDYEVNGFGITGHPSGSFVGADALQVGENPTANIIISNVGNASPVTNLTVSLSCSPATANCAAPITATVSAPAAGGSVSVPISLGAVSLATGSYSITWSVSSTVTEITTSNNSASTNFDVVDFTPSFSNGSGTPIAIFFGGNFSLTASLTQTGTTNFAQSFTQAITGTGTLTATPGTTSITPTPTGAGTAAISMGSPLTGTAGTATYTISFTNHTVTKTVSQVFSVTAPFTLGGTAPTLISGGSSQPLTITANTAGSIVLGGLPTGVSIDNTGSCASGAATAAGVATVGPQPVTWCLLANTTANTGAQSASISMTATTFTGTYTQSAPFTVNGLPTYAISAASPNFLVSGHSGAFTGNDALVIGETTTANVVVSNFGNASPAGTLTVNIGCSGGNFSCTPTSTTVAAPAVGQPVTANVPMPIPGGPGAGYTYTVSLTGVPGQGSTVNNSFTQSIDVMDFTITFTNGSGTAFNQFYGGSTTLNALLTVTGTTGFPALAVSQAISGVGTIQATPPATLTPGTPTAITIATPSTSATPGAATYSLSGTYKAVTRSTLPQQTFNIQAPFTQVSAPALTQGGASGALSVTANTTGTLTLGSLPSGVSFDASGACPSGGQTSQGPITVTTGQTVTWCLTAAAPASGALTAPVTITGTSVTYTGNVNFTVGAAPNYAIATTDVSFTGHASPYTGADALQLGETFSLVVTIHNTGTASPTGTITAHLTCTPPQGNATTECAQSPPDQTVAAPAVGATAQVTFAGLQFNDPIGVAPGFMGTVTITATDASNNPIPEQNTGDNTASTLFDITDFRMGLPQDGLQPQGGFMPYQNLLQPMTGVIDFLVTQNGTSLAYPVGITASGLANTSFTAPSTASTNATLAVVSVFTTASTPTGLGMVNIVGTNHGVSHTLSVPVNVLSETLGLNGANSDGTRLYLNDASNPLELQVGAPTPATTTFKLTGTDFANSGSAVVSIPAVTGFTTAALPASVGSNGTFDVQTSAVSGAPTTITPIAINAQIPNTNPQVAASFNLQVKALGVPDLVLNNFTVSGNASPWLSGQGMDFSIVLNNNGGSASAGGEAITGTLTTSAGASDLGCQVTTPSTGVPSIAANGTTTVTVHCVAPDLHDATYSATAPISFKIAADPAGDLNYGNNRLNGTIPFSNWHAVVSCAAGPCGASDAAPLTITIFSGGPWFGLSNVTATIDGGGSNTSTLNVGIGSVSSGLSLSGGTVSPGGAVSPQPQVSTSNASLQSGLYFAQLTLSLTDSVTGRTATRQATIHVSISNSGNPTPTGRTVSFTTSCGSGGSGCTGTGTPVQINGALAQQITATGNCSGCTSGGTYDFSVHDDPLTSTDVNHSGSQLVNGATFGVAQTLTVTAVQDPSGNIATGPTSTYSVNATAAQLSRARGISPDTGGVSQAVYFNVGDIGLSLTGATGSGCVNVAPNAPQVQLGVSWVLTGSFNQPSIDYKVEDQNFSVVGAGTIAFSGSPANGTLSFSGGYAPLTFGLSTATPTDGLQPFYIAVTITNGISSATKYFPFFVDGSLSQNFCGAASAVRGGASRIRGTWNRSMLGGTPGTLSAVKSKAVTAGKGMPDLRINSADISYTPSIPKSGDLVSFRFRITNAGDGDAIGVPVALQMNGVTVASDTFDVRAGASTLAGLTWTATKVGVAMPSSTRRSRAISSLYDGSGDAYQPAAGGMARVALALVVDPQHTIQQKTALSKAAAVPRFGLQPGGESSVGLTASSADSQRILLEIEEGACVGLRVTTGSTGMCGSADVEFTVEDLAKGTYRLAALNGIGDLGLNSDPFGGGGISAAQLSSVRYASDALAQPGHSYSVQLSGGRTGMLTIASVRSPGQLDAKTRAVFQATAIKVLKSLGADSQSPSAPGDVSGMGTQPVVYVELLLQSDYNTAQPANTAPATREPKRGASASRVQ